MIKNYESLRARILENLEEQLKPKRLLHTLGVESAAIALARWYGAEEEDASIAALLHDHTKYMNQEQALKCLQDARILDEYPELVQNPKLFHAFTGAEMIKEQYPMLSEDIINSVRYHTTGRPNMSVLEKIIFSADYIEPGRTPFPGLAAARALLFEDLDAGVCLILKDTVAYIEGSGLPCFRLTKEALQYYEKLVKPEKL